MADPKDKLVGPEPIVIPKRTGDDDFDKLGTAPSKSSIIVRDPDDDFVPLGTTPKNPGTQQLNLGIPRGPSQPLTDESISQVMNFIRPYVSATTGSVAGLMGGGIPGGAAAYTATDLLQKYTNPGTAPVDNVEAFTDSAKEGILNELIPRFFSGAFGLFKNVRNAGVPDAQSILNLYPSTSQALENYGYHKLAKVAGWMEHYGAPQASADALDRAGGRGLSQSLYLFDLMNGNKTLTNVSAENLATLRKQMLDTLEQGINKKAVKGQFQTPVHYASDEAYKLLTDGSSPFEAVDNVLASKDKLNKVLSVGQAVGPSNLNVRKTLQQYYWKRIFDEAGTSLPNGEGRIDTQKINDMWFNPKNPELGTNLETLYGKQSKANLDKFMQNIIDAQSGVPSTGLGNRLQYYGKGFGISGVLAPFLGAGPAGIGSMLYLANGTMGKILTNQGIGKDVIAALTGTGASLNNKILSRALFGALEGSRVAIMDQNQKKIWGNIARQADGSYQFIKE